MKPYSSTECTLSISTVLGQTRYPTISTRQKESARQSPQWQYPPASQICHLRRDRCENDENILRSHSVCSQGSGPQRKRRPTTNDSYLRPQSSSHKTRPGHDTHVEYAKINAEHTLHPSECRRPHGHTQNVGDRSSPPSLDVGLF